MTVYRCVLCEMHSHELTDHLKCEVVFTEVSKGFLSLATSEYRYVASHNG